MCLQTFRLEEAENIECEPAIRICVEAVRDFLPLEFGVQFVGYDEVLCIIDISTVMSRTLMGIGTAFLWSRC